MIRQTRWHVGGVTLIADRVDGLDTCGGIDPTPHLPQSLQMRHGSPLDLFPDGTGGAPQVIRYGTGSREKYVCSLGQAASAFWESRADAAPRVLG